MRELNQTEVMTISGGIDTGGYTFSFIVENTVTGCIIGIPFTLITANATPIIAMGALFGAYAGIMMATKTIDAYVF